MLYALTGVLLLGGGVWFLRAAPDTGADPRIAGWRETAERLLPDLPLQAMAETIVLTGELGTERSAPVDGGSYSLSMICAGTGQVRVRLSSTGNDSGRAVQCGETPEVDRLRVAVADEFFMRLTAENDEGGAVFRWRLERARGL
jgi:hypothetical protein